MKTLASNGELYEYLLGLAKTLQERQAQKLAEAVAHASRTAVGNSTEFLGESRIALRRVIKEERRLLTAQERADAKNVLSQIDGALEFGRYRR
jgi:hypothetical protein